MSIDWSQGGGLSPRIIPSTEPLPPAKRDNSKLILYVLLGVMLIVIAYLALRGKQSVSVSEPSNNPAEHYMLNFADGSHKAWSLALEEFDAGKFRDWKDMDEFLKPLLSEVVVKSEQPGINAIESINGKLWVAQNEDQKDKVKANRAAARRVIKSFADGYGK